eukprot:gene61051-83514_t
MEIISTLREAVASYKASKEAYKQAIQRRDVSSGSRDSFTKATEVFVATLTYSCKGLIALLPSDYGRAYEGIQFVRKECFDLISKATANQLPEDQKSYFDFVFQLSDAMLQPREADIVAALSADPLMPASRRSIMIEQLKRTVSNFKLQKLAVVIVSFLDMEYDVELLLLNQLRYLGTFNEAAKLHNNGNVYSSNGDLDRALRYYESDLAITQRLAPN